MAIMTMENIAHHRVLEAILNLPEMKGKTLIHLAIVGSRSKRLASHDSDYAVKAVILHSKSEYLLQKVTRSKSFKTTMEDPTTGEPAEVEGTLVDFLTAKNYVLATHAAAYDALFGIPVYETPESHYLKQLFVKAYNPRILVAGFQGLLRSEQKRAARQQRQGYIKYVANMVYYASAVHNFSTNDEPPQPDAFALLEQLAISPELRKQIGDLYGQRKIDKSKNDVSLEAFAEFLDKALSLEPPESKRVTAAGILEKMQGEANDIFLELVSRTNPLS